MNAVYQFISVMNPTIWYSCYVESDWRQPTQISVTKHAGWNIFFKKFTYFTFLNFRLSCNILWIWIRQIFKMVFDHILPRCILGVFHFGTAASQASQSPMCRNSLVPTTLVITNQWWIFICFSCFNVSCSSKCTDLNKAKFFHWVVGHSTYLRIVYVLFY